MCCQVMSQLTVSDESAHRLSLIAELPSDEPARHLNLTDELPSDEPAQHLS